MEVILLSRIHRELTELLLECSTSEKEEIGNQIVIALGGDVTKTVTNLPTRRGNSDGGIDGRIPIIIEGIEEFRRGNKILKVNNVERRVNAAFCIKIERNNFDRYELNAFIGDMEREGIFDGIIISVKPMSPDAKSELDRHEREGALKIRHILVENLLAMNLDIDFKLANGDSFKNIFNTSIKNYLKNIK